MANLLGTDYITAVTSLLNGDTIDSVLFYQYLSIARTSREMMRPFLFFRKTFTFTVAAVSTQPINISQVTGYALPTDFMYLSVDGTITLYNNNLQWQTYEEVPMNQSVYYLQENNKFWIDYSTNTIYFCGIIDQQYTAYIYYQADLGDITATTSWQNVPSRFQMMLTFDIAAMYRLGQDYDDINARNADNNARQADMIYNSMCVLDDYRQRSTVTTLDYPTAGDSDSATFKNKQINVNG